MLLAIVLTQVLWTSTHIILAAAAAFDPVGIAIGTKYSTETLERHEFVLDLSSPIATIDYGTERAGFPFFDIVELNGSVQIEVKYSEAFVDLENPWSDGPWLFNTAQANSFRKETFNITKTGLVKSPLLQGGLRWQSLHLLTDGAVTIQNVGLEATISTVETDQLPGAFSSSDESLNKIWDLGARAAIAACVDKKTQGAVWEVDESKGVYVTNQRTAQTVKGAGFSNYTLEFDGFIDRGGLWWSVAQPFNSGGLQLQLTADFPSESTFVNTNKTITPPESILLASGYGFVNQTTLTSYRLDTFKVPFQVKEKRWYRLKTVLNEEGFLSVFIDEQLVFNVSLSDYYAGGDSISTTGSFGFGAWQDQVAYFRNANVYDTANGSTLYQNPLTQQDVLAEYGTGENIASVCLDGPKRDRLVWLGDFYHTSRIIGASTGRFDQAKGTLEFLLKSQLENGQLAIDPGLAYDPSNTAAFAPKGVYGLNDYQTLGFLSFYHYIRQTNDLDFARTTWPKWEKQLAWISSRINSTDGLTHFDSAFLGDAAGGSAVSCISAETLRGAADIAKALGHKKLASQYRKAAESLSHNINKRLWNAENGTYGVSLADMSSRSVASTAFCISSGVASKKQTKSAVAALDELRLGIGYKDSSTLDPADSDTKISPNTNGFLLPAILAAKDWDRAADLIRNTWGAMHTDLETSSGASWEYLTPNGKPGLGAFTSLSHPWGGAATYVLTEWVAGIRSADNGEGFGYKNWIVDPELGVHMGLQNASATVPIFPNGALAVKWRRASGKLDVEIRAPSNTKGVFRLGSTKKVLRGSSRYHFTVNI